jgi:hypothetical protein
MPKSSKKTKQAKRRQGRQADRRDVFANPRVNGDLESEPTLEETIAIQVRSLDLPHDENPHLKEYIVQTTDQFLRDAIKDINEDKTLNPNLRKIVSGEKDGLPKGVIGLARPDPQKFVSNVKDGIMKYDSVTLNTHYESATQEWRDWCDDIAIFACAEYVFNDKKIPIIFIPEHLEGQWH